MPRHARSAGPRPFLKWAGGKTQLLEQFAVLYPPASAVRRYLEPFMGSGAVFFHVHGLMRPRRSLLADANEELVNAYTAVRDDVDEVIRLLSRHQAVHGSRHYYRIRALDPALLSGAARAARLIYLNKTCFNGLYRVNGSGAFNVPMGRYEDPPILDAANLRAASAALRGSRLRMAHFREAPAYARAGDFVYLDPPYHPVSPTASFTSYTRGSFSAADQEELAHVYAELARRGCLVMLSNSDCDFIRGLYRGFDLRTVSARRAINSRADRRGPISEMVVLNYRPEAPAGTQLGLFPAAALPAGRPRRPAGREGPRP